MKRLSLMMTCIVALAAIAPTALGQAAESQSKPGVLGYLDPQTGAFRPMPAAAENTDFLAATTFTGTVSVTLTITVKTTALTTFICSASVVVVDNPSNPLASVIWNESNTVTATGTGATRTCKLSIPYSWSLLTQASDSMSTNYTVIGSAGTTLTPQRTSGRSPLDVRKVPSSGTTTTLTAAVTQ